jgi:hypothetical protein
MYQAKHRRSGTEVYAAERDLHTRERRRLIGELRDAVARDHLTLHFQPMPADELEAWLGAGGFVLRVDDEDVEGARPVDALHAVQLDVGRRGGA